MSITNTFFTTGSSLKIFILRFISLYLLFYILPFPLDFIPLSYYLLETLHNLFVNFIDTIGPFILGEYYNYSHVTGSGDTSYKYTEAIVLAALAMTSTLGWLLFQRLQSHQEKLSVVIVKILVRYYLASSLIVYGFQKIFVLQFSLPRMRLTMTYGESSPMGLLWTFMGASSGYTILTGAGEFLAGVLLLFRYTKLVGAILAAFVLTHVFALNLFYDVPVKLYSFHLLFMSILLAATEAKRITCLFIIDKPIEAEIPALASNKAIKYSRIAVKALVITLLISSPLVSSIKQQKQNSDYIKNPEKDVVSGEYEISQFILNKDTLPATQDDTRRWKYIRISGNMMELIYMDGASIAWYCSIQNGIKKIRIASKDLSTSGEFSLKLNGSELQLHGIMNQNSIVVTAHRTQENSYRLLTRKFQWISEDPFYR